MREQDLAGAQPAAYRVTTRQDADAQAAADLICRDFTSQEPGSRLCGDITYIRTWAGWAYLAVVIDMASKMVVGWQLSNRANAQLCIEALEMAHRNGHCRRRRDLPLGSWLPKYTSGAFNACTSRLNVRQSMGRTGVCWDNAQAETFFASLKVECIYRTAIPTPPSTPAEPSAAISKSSTTAADGTQHSATRHPNSDTHNSQTNRRKRPGDDHPKFGTQPILTEDEGRGLRASIVVTARRCTRRPPLPPQAAGSRFGRRTAPPPAHRPPGPVPPHGSDQRAAN
jgi:transposase InsO family protein